MSRFGGRPIAFKMMHNKALHLAVGVVVVVLATISVVPSNGVHVELTPLQNFSLGCDNRWVPLCVKCNDIERTFPNYCLYYTERAKDETCKFQYFGQCNVSCRRTRCERKKEPLCARCGFEDLSFRNKCEYDNFNCLYNRPCAVQQKDYCKTKSGKIIYQKFHEKTDLHRDMLSKNDIFNS